MKRSKIKLLSSMLTAALLVTSLSACGKKENADNNKAATGNEQQTVTFWSWVPTESQGKAIVEAFQKKYPNIKVDYWRGEQTDYQKKLQVAMAANEGPDVLGLQVGGMLQQYSTFLEQVTPLADKNWGSGWQDKLVPAAVEQTKDKEGNVVALPINFTAQEFVLYNKTIFDKYGLKPPKTYDEWKAISDTLRKNNIIPVAMGAKDTWHDVDVFVALSNQFGPGKVYEAEAGKLPWTDQVFVDTMNAWKKMFDDKIFQEGALGTAVYPDARDQYYYAGKSAMFMTGSWHLSYFFPGGEKFGTKIENDETGVFILPQIGPNESKAVASVDTAVAINKDAKNKDAAWKLFSFMTMDEGQQIMADFVQGSPSRKDIKVQTLDQVKFQAEKDAINYANEKIQNAAGKRLLDYPELTNAIGVAMQDVVSGKKVEDALKDIQKVSEGIDR